MGRPLLLAVLLAALAPGGAAADCCLGPPVAAFAQPHAPLSARLRLTVRTDDPDRVYDATIRPFLDVGGHRIARLPALAVRGVSTTPQHPTLHVAWSVRRAAIDYGRRHHRRRAVLKLVVAVAGGRPYGLDSYLLLPR
jgi:hypothetical protein